MRFDIITIFPQIFDSYFNESIIKRAREKKLVDIRIHDLRAYVNVVPRQTRGNLPPRRQVDGRPYGGGPGMVIKIEPLARAIGSILKSKVKSQKSKVKLILFSAVGKQFDAKTAREWSKKYDRIIMIAGHYEGVDERIKKVVSDFGFRISDLSIGPYVLTGGEIPAMVVVDAVARHIPGVLGTHESLEENRNGVGIPMYTRPEIFVWPPSGRGRKQKKYRVLKVLLSGDHKKIAAWRKTHQKKASSAK